MHTDPVKSGRLWSRGLAGCLIVAGLLYATGGQAEWQVQESQPQIPSEPARFAVIVNEDGYKLEIYRDANNAIRSRFTLPAGLVQFAEDSCPTYQIDRGTPHNRSIHDAPCLAGKTWAEFVLGYIEDNRIASSSLLALMDGINITYRFILENGGYRATIFSLGGSRKAITQAIGRENRVTASR